MKLDDFLWRENIARYRRILSASKDEAERQAVLKLLAEEIAKQKIGDEGRLEDAGRSHVVADRPGSSTSDSLFRKNR